MAGEKSFAASEENGGVAVVKSLDFEDGGGGKIVEEDSALDFGLYDCVVDVVGEIGVRAEHAGEMFLRVYSKAVRTGQRGCST